MTYLPAKPTTTSTTAPPSQGLLPNGAQTGDQVLVFRPSSGTYYVNLTDFVGSTTTTTTTNRLALRNQSLLIMRNGAYLSHR